MLRRSGRRPSLGSLTLALGPLIGLGCQDRTEPPPPPAEAPASAPTSGPAAAPTDAHEATGPLSEAEFAALHAMKEGEAPKLEGETIEVGGSRAYLSLPDGAEAPLPAVLVIHEWWGLNDHIRHYADRIAAEGYAALAIDLYGGKTASEPETAMKYMKSVDAGEAEKVVAAGLELLRTDDRVKAPKVGSIGWCFGGAWSLRTALLDEELDAAIIYYGPPVTEVRKLETIGADLLAFYGEQDGSIPMEKVKAFEAALEKAGVDATVHTYDAGHAFANPSGANYVPEHAADAWTKATAFLDEKLTP